MRHHPSQPKEILKAAPRNCVLNVPVSLHSRPLRVNEMNPSSTIRFDKPGMLRLTPVVCSALLDKKCPQTEPQPPSHTEIPPARPADPLVWWSSWAEHPKERQRKGKFPCAVWGWKIPYDRWDPLVCTFFSSFPPTRRFPAVRKRHFLVLEDKIWCEYYADSAVICSLFSHVNELHCLKTFLLPEPCP